MSLLNKEKQDEIPSLIQEQDLSYGQKEILLILDSIGILDENLKALIKENEFTRNKYLTIKFLSECQLKNKEIYKYIIENTSRYDLSRHNRFAVEKIIENKIENKEIIINFLKRPIDRTEFKELERFLEDLTNENLILEYLNGEIDLEKAVFLERLYNENLGDLEKLIDILKKTDYLSFRGYSLIVSIKQNLGENLEKFIIDLKKINEFKNNNNNLTFNEKLLFFEVGYLSEILTNKENQNTIDDFIKNLNKFYLQNNIKNEKIEIDFIKLFEVYKDYDDLFLDIQKIINKIDDKEKSFEDFKQKLFEDFPFSTFLNRNLNKFLLEKIKYFEIDNISFAEFNDFVINANMGKRRFFLNERNVFNPTNVELYNENFINDSKKIFELLRQRQYQTKSISDIISIINNTNDILKNDYIDLIVDFNIAKFSRYCSFLLQRAKDNNDYEKNAVIIASKADHNSIFKGHRIIHDIPESYSIKIYEVSNELEFINAVKQNENIDLLIIAGHGNQELVTLGYTRLADLVDFHDRDFIREYLKENDQKYLDLSDDNLKELEKNFSLNANIVFHSCLVGIGGNRRNNLVNFFAELYNEITIHGPKGPIQHVHLKFDEDDQLIDVKYKCFLRKVKTHSVFIGKE